MAEADKGKVIFQEDFGDQEVENSFFGSPKDILTQVLQDPERALELCIGLSGDDPASIQLTSELLKYTMSAEFKTLYTYLPNGAYPPHVMTSIIGMLPDDVIAKGPKVQQLATKLVDTLLGDVYRQRLPDTTIPYQAGRHLYETVSNVHGFFVQNMADMRYLVLNGEDTTLNEQRLRKMLNLLTGKYAHLPSVRAHLIPTIYSSAYNPDRFVEEDSSISHGPMHEASRLIFLAKEVAHDLGMPAAATEMQYLLRSYGLESEFLSEALQGEKGSIELQALLQKYNAIYRKKDKYLRALLAEKRIRQIDLERIARPSKYSVFAAQQIHRFPKLVPAIRTYHAVKEGMDEIDYSNLTDPQLKFTRMLSRQLMCEDTYTAARNPHYLAGLAENHIIEEAQAIADELGCEEGIIRQSRLRIGDKQVVVVCSPQYIDSRKLSPTAAAFDAFGTTPMTFHVTYTNLEMDTLDYSQGKELGIISVPEHVVLRGIPSHLDTYLGVKCPFDAVAQGMDLIRANTLVLPQRLQEHTGRFNPRGERYPLWNSPDLPGLFESATVRFTADGAYRVTLALPMADPTLQEIWKGREDTIPRALEFDVRLNDRGQIRIENEIGTEGLSLMHRPLLTHVLYNLLIKFTTTEPHLEIQNGSTRSGVPEMQRRDNAVGTIAWLGGRRYQRLPDGRIHPDARTMDLWEPTQPTADAKRAFEEEEAWRMYAHFDPSIRTLDQLNAYIQMHTPRVNAAGQIMYKTYVKTGIPFDEAIQMEPIEMTEAPNLLEIDIE